MSLAAPTIHAPPFLWKLACLRRQALSRGALPSGLVILPTHPQYYGLIRLPDQLPSFLFLALWEGASPPHPSGVLDDAGWLGLPSPVPLFLTVTPLIPWRCHRPLVLPRTALCLHYDDADFVHEIGTRPPQTIFTRLPVRSLALRPGHSRSILFRPSGSARRTDYIVRVA